MIPLLLGDSTDQEYEITADMMVHDMDDETTMDEEELMADKEEFNEDELSELQKVSACKMPKKHFSKKKKKYSSFFTYYFTTGYFYQKNLEQLFFFCFQIFNSSDVKMTHLI